MISTPNGARDFDVRGNPAGTSGAGLFDREGKLIGLHFGTRKDRSSYVGPLRVHDLLGAIMDDFGGAVGVDEEERTTTEAVNPAL